MKNAIETIIFDLGGVLIDWNPEYVFREIMPDEEERRFFFREVCTHDWNIQQDAGRPLAEATEERVQLWPQYEAEIRAYYGRWEEMLGGPIEETVELLHQLHGRGEHRLYALTNWSHETFPVARERYDFLQLFGGIVVSGEEKLVKPDPRIYHLLFERYAVNPAQAVFIDDNRHNVEAARELGLEAIHFQSPGQLKGELQGLGVY
jgi:2-haloacid dehalogenase